MVTYCWVLLPLGSWCSLFPTFVRRYFLPSLPCLVRLRIFLVTVYASLGILRVSVLLCYCSSCWAHFCRSYWLDSLFVLCSLSMCAGLCVYHALLGILRRDYRFDSQCFLGAFDHFQRDAVSGFTLCQSRWWLLCTRRFMAVSTFV